MNLLYQLPQPVIFAHRGASAHGPENTLAAFRLAVQQGAPAIELDVKLTADQQVVVMHDATVDRTTDGSGKVSRMTLAEIKSLDAGSWFDVAFAGEPVPTLEEVLAELPADLLINIELTNYTTPFDSLVYQVVRLVRRFNAAERVLFSSFFPQNLLRAGRLLPDVPRAILTWPGRAGALMRGWLGNRVAPAILHPFIGDTTEELIQKAHKRNRRVHVWTVNEADDMRRLYAAGVDGLFTDDPALAIRLREVA